MKSKAKPKNKKKRAAWAKPDLTEEELAKKKLEAETRAALARCRCGKPEDFEPIVFRVKELPAQRMMDKLGHDMALNVCNVWLNEDKKCFVFTLNKNGIDMETKEVSYREACDNFGWKSFTLSDNKQTVYPVWKKSSL